NNIDNYLKKYGAENLAFDNSLAISTNPAFKDQRLTDIENMTPKERKTLYITYMEKGKDDATKYIKSLNPRIVKRKEKDILRFLGNDSKSRLYALATLNHKNRTLDGYKQTLRLLLGNDKNPPDLEALNKAIIKLENKEGSKQKSLIDGVGITNDIISSLILAYFLKGKSSEIETAKIFGRTYNNQMYSNKEGITLEATNKALKEAKQDALISEIAGRVSSPITNEIIDILRNVKIPIPDNGIIDLITDNLNSALLEKILRKDEIEENK
ncbi:hypothetical protein, partial [Anaerofustis sp.]|uniref:hypothetical protein n=1 Tax=Anaerofustis sp. TaxID=1872517 RepID=UPI0025B9404D